MLPYRLNPAYLGGRNPTIVGQLQEWSTLSIMKSSSPAVAALLVNQTLRAQMWEPEVGYYRRNDGQDVNLDMTAEVHMECEAKVVGVEFCACDSCWDLRRKRILAKAAELEAELSQDVIDEITRRDDDSWYVLFFRVRLMRGEPIVENNNRSECETIRPPRMGVVGG